MKKSGTVFFMYDPAVFIMKKVMDFFGSVTEYAAQIWARIVEVIRFLQTEAMISGQTVFCNGGRDGWVHGIIQISKSQKRPLRSLKQYDAFATFVTILQFSKKVKNKINICKNRGKNTYNTKTL
jgi:hypothetical protein